MDKHIVYRSRLESEVDEYWWSFLEANPWAIYIPIALGVALFLFVIGFNIYTFMKVRKAWTK